MLQESVFKIFKNVKKKKIKNKKEQRFRSLYRMFLGKHGRFRQNLLGKRADYSRRSVITSGPEIIIYQCGLPREIFSFLFQSFLIRFFFGRFFSFFFSTTKIFVARLLLNSKINKKRRKIDKIFFGSSFFINRAPTLHRFGFQSFQPKIIRGRSIKINSISCDGFNADFDGDQIAFHVILLSNSTAESDRLIIPGSHFFSFSIGNFVFPPLQDIPLGSIFSTIKIKKIKFSYENNKQNKITICHIKEIFVFDNKQEKLRFIAWFSLNKNYYIEQQKEGEKRIIKGIFYQIIYLDQAKIKKFIVVINNICRLFFSAL